MTQMAVDSAAMKGGALWMLCREEEWAQGRPVLLTDGTHEGTSEGISDVLFLACKLDLS